MSGDPPLPQRHSIRLATYDYRQAGAYFVTICTLNRACLFGEVVGGEMRLSAGGQVAREEWVRSAEMRREVDLDAFVIMPNHVHGVVLIATSGGERHDGRRIAAPDSASERAGVHRTPLQGLVRASLGAMVSGYKAAVTRRFTAARMMAGESVWQRNYYDHVIRHEEDLARIRQYIADNPAKWALDRENPIHHPPPHP